MAGTPSPQGVQAVSETVASQLEDHMESIWKMEIEPYLEEYFFDQQKTVDEFRWKEVGKHILPTSRE